MRKLIETWNLAREDSSNGELTYRMHGSYDRLHLEHGWWVDPNDWGLGIGFQNDWSRAAPAFRRYDGRVGLWVQVGPFSWSVAVCQAVTR